METTFPAVLYTNSYIGIEMFIEDTSFDESDVTNLIVVLTLESDNQISKTYSLAANTILKQGDIFVLVILEGDIQTAGTYKIKANFINQDNKNVAITVGAKLEGVIDKAPFEKSLTFHDQ